MILSYVVLWVILGIFVRDSNNPIDLAGALIAMVLFLPTLIFSILLSYWLQLRLFKSRIKVLGIKKFKEIYFYSGLLSVALLVAIALLVY